jgi:integrating conjugative element membrane protein (TIGR03747 family)
MAVKTQRPDRPKRILMNLFVLIVLGWLILFTWGFGLWFYSGFDKAVDRLTELCQKQRSAVTELSPMSLVKNTQFHLGSMPVRASEAGALINKELHKVLPEEDSEFGQITDDLLQKIQQAGLLLRLVTEVLLIKLFVLSAALPLLMLAITAGCVDGLNQRAIRTASLGRESSYVFHQLSRHLKRGLLLLLALWLAIPVSITPAFVFVPVSITLSILVSFTVSRFKKHM